MNSNGKSSPDMFLLLNPAERRTFNNHKPKSFFSALLQKKFMLIGLIIISMVFYLTFTGPFFWDEYSPKDNTIWTGKVKGDITTRNVDFETTDYYANNLGEAKSLGELPDTTRAAVSTTPPLTAPPPAPSSSSESMAMACHLPVLNPFDASVMPFDETPSPAECDKDHPFIFTTDFQANLITVQDPKLHGYHFCCYRKFDRLPGNDRSVQLDKKCTQIKSNKMRIPTNIDFIKVFCQKEQEPGSSNFTEVPVDLFGFVHLKPSVEKRVAKQEEQQYQWDRTSENSVDYATSEEVPDNVKPKSDVRKVNVVILGIDAVSHMNFIRTMKQSYDFIRTELSAIGMQGYTKVGDNTFPNLVPALVGRSVEEIQQDCWPSDSKPFDNCTFIWKEFASQGYRTAYGEDAVWMGIFNYQKKGFAKNPTDYYNNPLTYQMEQDIGHRQLMNAKLCYGPRTGFEASLEFVRKMAYTMGTSRRYFQFIWATSMFHDYLSEGKLGDKALLRTLKWFKQGGYLENTVLILMSDHGIRWGDIRSTLQGRLEERMPFLYFILPEWFKDKYRTAVSNLIRNQQRLTTPFDLHETLEDLLDLDNIADVKSRYDTLTKPELPRGISLFLPIPSRRTCPDAEIADHWCVCRNLKPVNVENNTLVEEAARSVVNFINEMFIKFPQCRPLTLGRVLNAQVFQSSSSNVKDASETISDPESKLLKGQSITFTLSFQVLPSQGTFEATATRDTKGFWMVSGEISRTNVYGDQSVCVTDYNLKKFCFCG